MRGIPAITLTLLLISQGASTFAQNNPEGETTTTTTTTTEAKGAPQAKEISDQKTRSDEFALGSKFYQTKKFAEALKHFQKAAATQADDGEARIMAGYCYYSLKQYEKALKEYTLAADKGKLISVRNKAQRLAQRLSSYLRGICPGNCLKPSMPGWRKMNVPGKPDRLVWMVYPYLDPEGRGGSEFWSNDHMGEVIEYVNGRPINKGVCPICNGTGKVSLPK